MTTIRWVPSRKAALIDQIDSGILTLAEARHQFDLSPEELGEWKRARAAHGVPGLRVTRLQIYKDRSRGHISRPGSSPQIGLSFAQ